ncbi:putative periplasmic iron-binding protein precursor [Candidatus Arsenophonus lipoptenae]|uniref:Putative periplasmic iron-binding protein n=1 Tax=Candidatus Arsenophonus lipoptenae TaxID=634113 RepID=A0A0X9VUI6_9GAMM|nr:metal ABC transporter substrate-binding protein [Candidatus Arsenophonus lipoptenae]AMA64833.1 putative periplasmic iron-binding protein precursor [Candidatus Arsenophonus lipoptenae]
MYKKNIFLSKYPINFFINLFKIVVFILLINPITYAKKITVVTTFTIIQDIVKNIAGNAANVQSITKVGAEIHGYQPTPKDILKLHNADLILWNGLGLEIWFHRFFDDFKHIPIIIVTKGIKPIPIQEGEYKGNPNPHAWMSAKNIYIYIENIRAALVKYDPKNANVYNKNAKIYYNKINKIDIQLRKRLEQIPLQKRWLVTSEGAFSYLAKDYGFQEVYLWPINVEEQGSPKQVSKVINIVKKYHIPVVFSESTVSDKPAKQVSKETGAKYGGVLYVDSLSTSEGPVPTYIELLKTTIDTIAKGFGT